MEHSNKVQKGKAKNLGYGSREGHISRSVVASFVSSTFVGNGFGEIAVPTQFNSKFGKDVVSPITLFCKEGFEWRVEYVRNEEKIRGMLDFLLHHKAKQNNILIFDYHGKSDFSVQVYKSCGIEVDFNGADTIKCKYHVSEEDRTKTEYLVERDWLENAKSAELLQMTGYYDWDGCNQRTTVTTSILNEPHGALPITAGLMETWKHWKNGDPVTLIVRDLSWEAKIIMDGPYRVGGSGWFRFVKDIGIEINDVLLLRTIPGRHDINVGVLKKEDVIDASIPSGQRQNNRVSFFQFARGASLRENRIAPPFIVENNYRELLSGVSSILCGGREWPFIYWKYSHYYNYFKGSNRPFNHFNVQGNDTIFITITEHSQAKMRIYRKNGMEVLYDANGSDADISATRWYLDKIFDANFYEDENGENDEAEEIISEEEANTRTENTTLSFSQELISCHVDKKSHGLYLDKEFALHVNHWNADTKLVLHVDQESWLVGVNVTNNRIRFCSGWNKFVRDKSLQAGDTLTFHLLQDGVSFTVEIIKKPKRAMLKHRN